MGKIAGTNLVPCAGNKAQAQSVFTKKFLDKTKNKWDERRNFQKVAGKYDLLEMDYAPSVDTKPDTSKVKKEEEEKPEEELKCQLDDKIQVSVDASDDVFVWCLVIRFHQFIHRSLSCVVLNSLTFRN